MNKVKKLSIILLAIVFWMTAAISVGAADNQSDAVEITVTTDKQSYDPGEEIAAKVTVKNNGDVELNDVSVELIVPKGYQAEGKTSLKLAMLKGAGESAALELALSPVKTETPDTGDESRMGYWGLLLFAAVVVLAGVIICRRKLSGKWLGVFFGAVFLVISLSAIVTKSAAAEDTVTVSASKTVTVGDEELVIEAKVTYSAPTETESTTEAEEPTTEAEEPTTGAKEPTTGAEEPTAETEEPTTGAEEPTTGVEAPTTGSEEPTTGAEDPTTGTEEPTTGTEAPTASTDVSTESSEEPTEESTEPVVLGKVYIDSISDQGITASFPSSKGDNFNDWEAMEEGGLKYIHLLTEDDSTPYTDITTGVEEDVRQYVYSVDVYLKGDTVGNKIFIGRTVDSSGSVTLLVIEKDGSITVNNQPIGRSVVFNEWMEFAIAVDRDAGTCAVYINDELVVENWGLHKYPGTNVNPEKIRIGLYSDSASDGVGVDAWFNRVKLYEGLELREFDDEYIVLTPEEQEEALREAMKNTVVETDSSAKLILTDDIAFSTTSAYFYAQGDKHEYAEFGADAYYEDDAVMVDVDVLAYALGMEASVSGGKVTFGNVSVDVIEKSGDYFADAAAIGRGLDKYVYDTDNRNFVVLSNTDKGYVNTQSPYNNLEQPDVIWRYLHFDRPTGDELYNALISNASNQAHPRLLVKASELETLRANVVANADMKAAYEELLVICDKYLLTAPTAYRLTGSESVVRAYQAASDAKDVMFALSMAYLISGEEKYAERLWDELENVCTDAWPDWNVENHFLDSGMLGNGVAVAYDTLYNWMTDDQKAFVREAVTEKYLNYCVSGLAGTWGGYPYQKSKHMASNWGASVNFSMLSLATAFMDEEDADSMLTAKCKYIAQYAVSTMEGIATALAPEGINEESMNYYEITEQHLGGFLEILNNVYGDTYNFLNVPGMREYPMFAMYNESREGAFNLGGVKGWYNTSLYMPPEAFIYASLYNDADSMIMYNDFRKLLGISGYEAEFLMFYDPQLAANGSGNASELELDKHYESSDINISRGSWVDADTLYLGTTGAPDSAHAENVAYKVHRDAGSFVLDLLDERWAFDLGRNSSETMKFVYLPESHNILLIDPDGTIDSQKTYLGAPTIVFESKERGTQIVYDMSAVYPEKVTQYIRGFYVGDDRQSVTIRDELTLTGPSKLEWNFITDAEIVIADDGKSAVLSKNGKQIRIEGICNVNGWTFIQTEDMAPTGGWVENDKSPVSNGLTYTIEEQKAYAGALKRLVLSAEGSGDVTITVKVTPVVEGESFAAISDAPISTWEIPDGELPERPVLNALFADGEPVAEFQSGVREYVLPLVYGSAIPQFSATAPEGCTITYDQAETTADTAKITVTRDGKTVVYKISFKMEISVTDALVDSIVVGLPEGVQLPQATDVYATYEPQSQYPAIHVIDQRLDTYWTSDVAGNYVEVDFGEVLNLSGVAVAFNYGDQRNYLFDILVSTDKMNYTRIYSGQSTGLTSEYEYIEVPIEARYIRLVGSGHLDGKWTAVKELQAVVASSEGSGSGEGTGSGEGSGDSGDDVVMPSGPKVYLNTSGKKNLVDDSVLEISTPAASGVTGGWSTMENGGNEYLNITNSTTKTVSVYMPTNVSATTDLRQYIYEVDLYIEDTDENDWTNNFVLNLLDSEKTASSMLLNIKYNKTARVGDSEMSWANIGTIPVNQWFTVAIAVDRDLKTCILYLDGTLVGTYELAVDANPELIQVAVQKNNKTNDNPNGSSIWFDHFKLYSGTELLDE